MAGCTYNQRVQSIRTRVASKLPLELLWNLTLRELRGQYKNSSLGWAWSVLRPLIQLVVFMAVFSVFLKIEPSTGDPSGLKSYGFFLMVGLLPWGFHQIGVTAAARSLSGNSALIGKVFFPRWVLPTSTILALFFTFLIEMGVLLVAMALVKGHFALLWVPALIPLILLQLVFVVGFGLLVSSVNLYLRDVEHFLGIAMQPWMYLTPILYPLNLVPNDRYILGISYRTLYQLNPMVSWIKAYRNILYDLRFPSPERWGALFIGSFLMLAVGAAVFRRLEPRFAEEV